MTTVYLHIGTPKTGTSYIQKFLFLNREKLLEKGYLYPITATNPTKSNMVDRCSHNDLARALVYNHDQNNSLVDRFGVWEELKREIDAVKPKNVIISAELFIFLKKYYNQDMISSLSKKILDQYETKIVIYIRRQDDFFRSYYCELIKFKILPDIKEFIQEWKYQGDYYKTLELWKKSFGSQNIIVRPMEKKQLKNNNLIEDFCASIKLSYDESEFNLIDSKFKNIAIPGQIIKIISWIDKRREQEQLQKKRDWYDLFLLRIKYLLLKKNISTLISYLLKQKISEELLSKEDRLIIMEEFEESNQKVAKEYLGREDGRLFYTKP